ncbi:unnamed protein product [Caenorhabditis nigoni]|nr:hypothetical protein B9Z55_025259 [Caenorhabditis nigoni]
MIHLGSTINVEVKKKLKKLGETYDPLIRDQITCQKNKSLFSRAIRNYNGDFLRPAGEVEVFKHTFEQTANTLESSSASVTLNDFRFLGLEYDDEKDAELEMSDECLRFGLLQLQPFSYSQMQSNYIMFGLNTCKIHEKRREQLRFEIEEWWDATYVRNDNESRDIFEKKFLIFPVYMNSHVYVTVVVNPKALFQKRGTEPCKIFHMGTGPIKRYSLMMTGKFFDLIDFHREKLNKPPFVAKSFHTKKVQNLEPWTTKNRKMQLIWTVNMMLQEGCDRINNLHYNLPTVYSNGIGTGDWEIVARRFLQKIEQDIVNSSTNNNLFAFYIIMRRTVYLISSVEEFCSWTPRSIIEKVNTLLT